MPNPNRFNLIHPLYMIGHGGIDGYQHVHEMWIDLDYVESICKLHNEVEIMILGMSSGRMYGVSMEEFDMLGLK